MLSSSPNSNSNNSNHKCWLVTCASVVVLLLCLLATGFLLLQEPGTWRMGSKPEMHHLAGSKFAQFVLDRCSTCAEPFKPVWWASGALMQTVWASVVRSRLPEMSYRRQLIATPDGGQVSLDWLLDEAGSQPKKEEEEEERVKPIAVLFPGIIGDSQSEYLRHVARSLARIGYRVAAFNNRGMGGMELLTPRLYCAANCEDLELALNEVRRENPRATLVATGFSMGAIVLSRHLCDRANEAVPDAAILVSGSYDLLAGAKFMEQGLRNRAINRVMARQLARVLLRNREPLSRVQAKDDKLAIDWDKVSGASTLRELDASFTCPMWNFDNPDEYAIASSNGHRMNRVAVPTMALNSADDLFSPYSTLPLTNVSDSTLFVVTQTGGHLGFMDTTTCPFYGDRLIEQLHSALLGQTRDSLKAMRSQSTTN